MRNLLIIVTLALAPLTMAQGIDDTLQDKPGATLTGENDRNDQTGSVQANPDSAQRIDVKLSGEVTVNVNGDVTPDPRWLTRKGVEEAAKAYFEGKRQLVLSRNRGDSAGMRRAVAQMREMNPRLDAYKKAQTQIDKGQDTKIGELGTKVSGLSGRVGTLEKTINGDGKNPGLTKRVEDLEKDHDAYALSGVPGRLSLLEGAVVGLIVMTVVGLLLIAFGFRLRPRTRRS